jgi:hypothetical protein
VTVGDMIMKQKYQLLTAMFVRVSGNGKRHRTKGPTIMRSFYAYLADVRTLFSFRTLRSGGARLQCCFCGDLVSKFGFTAAAHTHRLSVAA